MCVLNPLIDASALIKQEQGYGEQGSMTKPQGDGAGWLIRGRKRTGMRVGSEGRGRGARANQKLPYEIE